jgi:hypothetical protein
MVITCDAQNEQGRYKAKRLDDHKKGDANGIPLITQEARWLQMSKQRVTSFQLQNPVES